MKYIGHRKPLKITTIQSTNRRIAKRSEVEMEQKGTFAHSILAILRIIMEPQSKFINGLENNQIFSVQFKQRKDNIKVLFINKILPTVKNNNMLG